MLLINWLYIAANDKVIPQEEGCMYIEFNSQIVLVATKPA